MSRRLCSNLAPKNSVVLHPNCFFLWSLLRNIPLAAADPEFGLAWTNLGKALAFSGLALLLSGALPRSESAVVAKRAYASAG
jgi:hypothetical protein